MQNSFNQYIKLFKIYQFPVLGILINQNTIYLEYNKIETSCEVSRKPIFFDVGLYLHLARQLDAFISLPLILDCIFVLDR